MAMSIDELRRLSQQKAKQQDDMLAGIASRVASNANRSINTQSAQVASRLDNIINSPSVTSASNQRSAQIANRLNTGAVTSYSGGRQAQIVQAAKDYKKSQGGTLMEQATSMNFADSVKPDLTKIMPTEKIAQASFTNPSGKDYYGAEQDRKWYDTVWDTIGAGAGKVNQGAAATLDFAANLLPRLEGELFGATPESTVSGQLLRPVTDATGKLKDYVNATTTGLVENINEDTKDSKAANIAVNLGSDVIAAVPNAVLAYLSAGQSAVAQLGARSAGVTGTISTAATKMLQNPMFKYSFAQSIGSNFDEAKAAGATDAEAMTAATISSLFNAAIETSGGIEALPDNLRGVDLSTQDKVLSWLSSIPQEGFEEVVQGVVTGLTNKLTFDEGKALYSPTDENAVLNPGRMWQEFGTGAAVAGILGGGQLGANLIGSNINDTRDPIGKALEQQKTTQPTGEERVAQVVRDIMGKTENAPVNETETVGQKPRVSMAEFMNPQSDVFTNLAYDDVDTQRTIMQQTHQDMVANGAVVKIPEDTTVKTSEYYPDLRSVKKKDRTAILKEKVSSLKTELRKFLNGLKGVNFEFEVNGNILDAKLYDTGVREVMEKVTQDKAAMLQHSDEIFRNAQYLYSTPDYDGDPNIYRWNYFYTPVQIGDETVGVRIAVRDMAKTKDSQIYNWGIKKDATLGGGGGGKTASHTDASSVASNNTILNPPEIVNSQKMEAMGAADYGFSPYSNYQNTQTEFIPEGANASRPVDVPATDPTGKNTRRFASNAMGAQTVPDRAVPTLEGAYMEGRFGYEVKGDKKAVEKANAQVAENYDRTYAQTIERLQSMKNLKQTVVDAEVLISKAYQEGRDADAAELILLLAESGTEFGQAVQAFSIFRKLTPEGQLEGIRRTVKRINEKNAKKSGGMKVAGVTVDEGLAQKFLDAKTEQEREAVMEEIYQDIGSKLDTTLGEVANQWRYTAMLLNPSTHIKNIAGNTTQLAEATVKDAIATIGEVIVDTASKVVRKGKGIQRTKAFLNHLSEADRNLLQMAGADYANVRDEIMGVGKYQNTPEGKINQYKTTMKLNNPKNKVEKAVDAILRGAGKVADWNSAVMDVEDSWFSKPRYQAALAGYMKANGLTEITAEARKYAITEAQKSTYRDANAISDWARSLGRSKLKPINFFVNAIFPFKATPANVGVRAVEYSPAGLVSTVAKAAKAIHNGKFSAASFIDDLSANITGSALAGVGIWLAQQGILRVKGIGDKKEREQMEAEGYEQNSVNLFDHSIPISAFGAASVPLLFGGAIYENFIANNPDDQGHPIDDFLDALGGTLDPIAETTMLTGFQDAVRDFQQYDPDAGTMSAFSKGLINVAGNYVASYIPTLLSKAANATDTAARQVYVDRNKDAQDFQGEAQAWMKKIPGLRQKLTEQVDAYGNTVEGGLPTDGTAVEKAVKAILGAVSPTYGSEIKTTELDEELRRLYRSEAVDSGDYSLLASDAPKNFEVDGKTVYLTGEQWEQYAKTLNGGTHQIRNSVMENERYDDLPDDIRAAAMDSAKQYANAIAKAGLDVGYKIKTKWMNELAGATPEEVADAIITRSIENAAEDYEGGKYAGLGDMLDSGTIEDKIAISLLPQEQYDRYMKYGKGVPAADLMDALAYKNSDASKGLKDEDGKDIKGETRQDHIEAYLNEKYKGSVNKQIKIGIWCTLYPESTCPWK